MAISRPFLLALLGAVLLGATFFAVQNARDDSDDAAPAPAAQQAAPEQQAAAPAEPAPAQSPEDTLKSAFQLPDVASTAFDTEISMSSARERLGIDISGAFERGAANDVPELELDASMSFEGQRVEGGFVSLGDEAYFIRGDTGWRLPDEAWNPVVQAFANGAAERLQEFSLGVDADAWIREARSEGTETLDGVETTHVSAAIDPRGVAEDLVALARQSNPEVASARDIARTVESIDVEAWVADDRVPRRILTKVVFAPPPELRGPNDAARSEISVDLTLTGVNEPQEIEAPADVRPGMPGGELGRFAEGFVTGLSGVGGAEPVSLSALTSPNPQRAARAVAEHKQVVILFHNPEGLDDRAMRRNMDALARRTDALVLVDHVDAVDRYGKMVEDLGVSQTPSVVLIDRTGEARLIEGYVDTETLAQAVADAR
jgi:hypothetical protein